MRAARKLRAPPSEETRKKTSEALKGEKHPLFGKHLSEEYRQKISAATKGKVVSEETCRKISDGLRRRAAKKREAKKDTLGSREEPP